MPAWLAPALIAGGTLASGGLNAWATSSANAANAAATLEANKQNINNANMQWMTNRMWALDDWNRSNAYNSPLQQMQRLKEAGLNPHLVYGNGAQNTAAMVRGTDSPRATVDAPRMAPIQFPDLGGMFAQIYDIQAKQAQTDNMKTQNELLQKNLQLKDLEILGKTVDNERKGFDLGLMRDMADAKVMELKLRNDMMLANTKKATAEMEKTSLETYYIDKNFALKVQELRLKQAKTAAEVESINKDILIKTFQSTNLQPEQFRKLKTEVDNLEKTGMLKQLDLNMRSAGLNPNDPAYMRILVQIGLKLAENMGVKLDASPAMPADPLKMLHGSPLKYQLK